MAQKWDTDPLSAGTTKLLDLRVVQRQTDGSCTSVGIRDRLGAFDPGGPQATLADCHWGLLLHRVWELPVWYWWDEFAVVSSMLDFEVTFPLRATHVMRLLDKFGASFRVKDMNDSQNPGAYIIDTMDTEGKRTTACLKSKL